MNRLFLTKTKHGSRPLEALGCIGSMVSSGYGLSLGALERSFTQVRVLLLWAWLSSLVKMATTEQSYLDLVSDVGTSLVAQMVKHLPTMRETWVWSLGREYPLGKEMATHSSTLAWKIPQTEEPGKLQSMGSQRVRHGWVTSLTHWETVRGREAYEAGVHEAAKNWTQISDETTGYSLRLKLFPGLQRKDSVFVCIAKWSQQ